MQPEYFLERRKLKRQLINWKIACALLIAAVIAISKFLISNQSNSNLTASQDYIGSIYINGIIMEDKKRSDKINEIYKDDKIKALVVYINSPGGSTGGSEDLYRALRKISVKKPVVAVMNTLAASGGYMTALAADYIVAHNLTITGSIGVLWQNTEVTNLAEKLGITFNSFKSGPLKASPNMVEKVTPEVEEATMSMIKDSYEYFVELVAERRKLPKEQVIKIADGRVYTGRQAYDLKLVDMLGNTDEALKWLHTERNIDSSLKVMEIELKPKTFIQKLLGDDLEQKAYNLFLNAASSVWAL